METARVVKCFPDRELCIFKSKSGYGYFYSTEVEHFSIGDEFVGDLNTGGSCNIRFVDENEIIAVDMECYGASSMQIIYESLRW
ncbi:MAG: hypothetical protein IJX38_01640 [Clostridia bacterium]|nr:hypothetical protein [Clostridia bacterium]